MTGERKFIRENTNRLLIKEFLVKKIEGAGFGGMNIQRTPMGTRINILVERPGMVIGKSGNKIKELTEAIKENFKVDNPQIEIEEAGNKASLNAQIMAGKLAEALERGWHFRRAGHSSVRRIMGAGAKGCQIVIAGKLTGARHRTEDCRV
jgi:small subunit ribosomal protein S3